MPDKEQVLREVRELARDYVINILLAAHFARAEDPEQAAREFQHLAEAVAREMTFPHLDPAMSDYAAQEFRDSLIRMVHRAAALASGEPLDPASYLQSGPS